LVCLILANSSGAEPLGPEALGPSATEKDPEIQDAEARFKEGDFEGAREHLRAAVKKNPDLSPPEVLLAGWFAQAAQANVPNAGAMVWASLEKATTDTPADPEAFAIMGDLLMREGRVTPADLLYNKASGLMAKFTGSTKRKEVLQPRVLAGLARVAEARQDWAGAQKLLEGWLKLDAKNASVMWRIGRALFKQKDANGSLAWLAKAKEADSTNVLTPEAQLALFYEEFPDHANAVTWMEKALKKAAQDLKTQLAAAEWALNTGQLPMAKDRSAAALQIEAKSLEAKILRGIVALFQKDYKEAELYFESAHLQSPGSFAASNNLALALVEQSDETKKRRAEEYAEDNVRKFPRLAEALSTYGWVLYKRGKLDQAEEWLKRAAQAGSLSADTAYYIARVTVEKGRPEEAKRLLKQALDTKRPFCMRDEAKALLEKLEKSPR